METILMKRYYLYATTIMIKNDSMCSYNHDSKNYSIHIQFWWKNTLYTLNHDKKLLYATRIMIKNYSLQLQSCIDKKITPYSFNIDEKLLHTATIMMKDYSIQLQYWWKITPYSYSLAENLLTATIVMNIITWWSKKKTFR